MTGLRRAWVWLTTVRVAERTAALVAGASAVVFLIFAVLWLWLSTENVALLAELERLEQRQIELQEEANALWAEIGEATSPRVMAERARRLGFAPPEAQEVLPAADR